MTMEQPALRLKSFEFRREREKTWKELERLVARVEKSGVRALAAEQLARLPVLYRATLSSLQARGFSTRTCRPRSRAFSTHSSWS